jgi:hypothetical protein
MAITECRSLRGLAIIAIMACTACPLAAQQVVELPGRDRVVLQEPRTLFTVGEADGAGADVFGSVGDVAFDSAENLYVLDRLNARVVMFDSTGRFLRTMGRRGGGPAEFSAPQQMAVTRAGEVMVSDAGRRGVVVFRQDGQVRSIPYPGTSLLMGRRLVAHPGGGVVSLAMGNPAARGAGAFGEEVLLWLEMDGTSRTITIVSTPRSRETRSGGVRVHEPPIFSPSFRWAVLPGGVAVVDDANYAIRILDRAGRTLRILRRPIAPRPVTARDREYEIERRSRQQTESGGLRIVGPQSGPLPDPVRRSLAEQLRNAQFARVIPVIRRIGVDASGTLWIERSGPAQDRPGGVDLIDPAGRYRGTLAGWEVPAAFSPGGRAAFVREDALGVQRVVVARL